MSSGARKKPLPKAVAKRAEVGGEEDDEGSSTIVPTVVFSGTALKEQLRGVFDFERDDSESEAEENHLVVSEQSDSKQHPSSLRAGIGATTAQKTKSEKSLEKDLGSWASKTKEIEKGKKESKKKTSALDGIKAELTAWKEPASSDEEEDMAFMSKGQVVRQRDVSKPPTLAAMVKEDPASLIIGQSSGKKSKRSKKNRKKGTSQSQASSSNQNNQALQSKQGKEGQEAEEHVAIETSTTKDNKGSSKQSQEDHSDVKTKQDKESNKGFKRSIPQGDQSEERPPKKYKKNKKRSKQKNIKKDNRPAGSWMKNKDNKQE